jgi:uncharacterized protein with NRDE domain
MCLILLAFKVHPDYPFIVAANRDEYHSRPTAAASFWEDYPQLLAGRDLLCNGTWLGITTNGRFAALTNYRDPSLDRSDATSRGLLVSDYLSGSAPAEGYLSTLTTSSKTYNSFNLLAGTTDELYYYSNLGRGPEGLLPCVHGLSNNLLNAPWPKVTAGISAINNLLPTVLAPDPEPFFKLLADREPAPDNLLPDTGIGIERERLLSPLFICNPVYGTRSSTVILLDRKRKLFFSERTFGPAGENLGTASFQLEISDTYPPSIPP